MKANINLEIEKEDLAYELKELVSEIASEEIRRMVKDTAKRLVDEEVKRIIAPVVDNYLENALVGREYNYHERNVSRRPVDEYMKIMLCQYLDEPVYDYSKTSNEISKRYMPSSPGGEKKTRAEQWVTAKARQYVDAELFEKLEIKLQKVASAIIPNEEKMQQIINEELRKILQV